MPALASSAGASLIICEAVALVGAIDGIAITGEALLGCFVG